MRLGMRRREIMATPLCEMLDMMDCNAIVRGAKRKAEAKDLGYYLFDVR